MRIFGCLLVFVLAAALVPSAATGEEPPAPKLDRVDYARPMDHLGATSAMGPVQRALGIAGQLRGNAKPSAAVLGKILRWTDRNLRMSPETATWRGIDELLQSGRVHSDGDRAYAIGALARAAGIPTAWVKSVSKDWLVEARAGTPLEAKDARTFLEVHLDGAWQLVDPVTARLYDNYDRRRQLLPGDYLAYDKGSDPHALVLDNRPGLYRVQLDRYVAGFDKRRLPWSTSQDLLAPWRVYVTGQSGGATYAKEAARTLGFKVERSFDSGWDANLAAARGSTLIVTTRGGTPVLPATYHAAWLPPGWKAAAQKAAAGGKGWVKHRLADGTRVILVLVSEYGPVELAVSEALEG